MEAWKRLEGCLVADLVVFARRLAIGPLRAYLRALQPRGVGTVASHGTQDTRAPVKRVPSPMTAWQLLHTPPLVMYRLRPSSRARPFASAHQYYVKGTGPQFRNFDSFGAAATYSPLAHGFSYGWCVRACARRRRTLSAPPPAVTHCTHQ
jgi:hypothetical protein